MTSEAKVIANINGTAVNYTEVFVHQGHTYYRIDVPADDPTTPEREGGRPGDTIVFTVDGRPARPTATWRGGTNTRLDLTVVHRQSPRRWWQWLPWGLADLYLDRLNTAVHTRLSI